MARKKKPTYSDKTNPLKSGGLDTLIPDRKGKVSAVKREPEKETFTMIDEQGKKVLRPGIARIMIFLKEEYQLPLIARARQRKITPSHIINEVMGEWLKKHPIDESLNI